jgi:hypothetical protein
VSIIVAAGAALTVGVAVDLDAQRRPQDHLPIVAHTVAMMIMAMATPDLALPAPSCGGPVAVVVGFDYLSHDLRRAAPERCQALRTSSATPNDDQGPAL